MLLLPLPPTVEVCLLRLLSIYLLAFTAHSSGNCHFVGFIFLVVAVDIAIGTMALIAPKAIASNSFKFANLFAVDINENLLGSLKFRLTRRSVAVKAAEASIAAPRRTLHSE